MKRTLTGSQLILNQLLEGKAFIMRHGICLGADWHYIHFPAQPLDELLVHGREAVGGNKVQTGVNQQVIPPFP